MSTAEKLIAAAQNEQTLAQNEQTIAENEQRVYDAGRIVGEQDRFERYVKAAGNDFLYAFGGRGWTDATFTPTSQLNATARSTNMFSYSEITKIPVAVKIASSTTTNKLSTFQNATYLEYVEKFIIDETQRMSEQFKGCTALTHLRIEGTIGLNAKFQWCPLTRESIENVVSCLSDIATEVTCTFKTSAVNNAFTTEEWDALKATKPNWTFALVD